MRPETHITHFNTHRANKRSRFIIPLIFLLPSFAPAQRAEMWLDTNTISIGEPVDLTIDLKFTSDIKVDSLFWPVFGDTITSQIEKLNESEIDTIRNNPSNEQEFSLRQIISLTAWDSGYWAIPPVSFLVEGDTIYTKALLIHVVAPDVDVQSEMKDIAGIYDIELTWMDLLRKYWYLLVAAILLIGVIIWFVVRRNKKGTTPLTEHKPEPSIPPGEKALTLLLELRSKSFWQNGMIKEYYSELTNITRSYFEEKYGLKCMESTTAETMSMLRNIPELNDHLTGIKQLLLMGDMAKFAKQKPGALENERAIDFAIELVKNTMNDDTKVS